jgi:hypothetical protein
MCDGTSTDCKKVSCDTPNVPESYCTLGGNGGTPLCHCPPGYQQSKCDFNSTDCQPQCVSICDGYCQNNGSCSSDYNSPHCECDVPYYGQHCELNYCDQCDADHKGKLQCLLIGTFSMSVSQLAPAALWIWRISSHMSLVSAKTTGPARSAMFRRSVSQTRIVAETMEHAFLVLKHVRNRKNLF